MLTPDYRIFTKIQRSVRDILALCSPGFANEVTKLVLPIQLRAQLTNDGQVGGFNAFSSDARMGLACIVNILSYYDMLTTMCGTEITDHTTLLAERVTASKAQTLYQLEMCVIDNKTFDSILLLIMPGRGVIMQCFCLDNQAPFAKIIDCLINDDPEIAARVRKEVEETSPSELMDQCTRLLSK